MQRHPVLETVIGNIASGDVERVPGNIHRVDMSIWKTLAREDGKAARTGAEVQHALDREGILDQGAVVVLAFRAEMGIQQLADEGARHDAALVDIEGQA